jgi:hypothetical protein
MHNTFNPYNLFLTRCSSSTWVQPSSTATRCLCSDRPHQSLSSSTNLFCRSGRLYRGGAAWPEGFHELLVWERLMVAWGSWRQGGRKPAPPWRGYMPEGVGERNLSGGRRARWMRRPAAGALAGGGSRRPARSLEGEAGGRRAPRTGSRRSGRASAGESSGRGAHPQELQASGGEYVWPARQRSWQELCRVERFDNATAGAWSDDDNALPFLVCDGECDLSHGRWLDSSL